MFHEVDAPESSLPYTSDRIKFIPIEPSGGKSIAKKLGVLASAPKVIRLVNKTMKKVDCFQLRAPTGIGVFLIPYLTLFSKKKGWYKYAGNWNQSKPPLGYAIQRYFLKRQHRKVTINGTWKNQKSHCITFENPCLTDDDLISGKQIRQQKSKEKNITFCYAGRLETEKGVERSIKALNNLPDSMKEHIGQVHLVGNGSDLEYFKTLASSSDISYVFHGFLSTQKLFEIYKKSHFFVMSTTASEGFPKVIAESMNFGCVPLVSNISSIGQYVKNTINGILIEPVTVEQVELELRNAIDMSEENYKSMIEASDSIVERFSYQYYINRIKNMIH